MRKIYLIAGHNLTKSGFGTGANGFLNEAVEAIHLRDEISREIERLGVTPIRDCNTDSLNSVISWLRSKVCKKDILIDIHFNASASASANGTEVVLPNYYNAEERIIAEKLLSTITDTMGTKSRGIKTEKDTAVGTIGILNKPDCNNILLEICFITNQQDVSLYRQSSSFLAINIANILVQLSTDLK
ncbi:MAG: N-acetylmuramoyl-L-alanine amidase [Bacteroidota bacterium]|nr:N-acetylmuramoyl-L-alanine amidase [Bacteroidota bacterium]